MSHRLFNSSRFTVFQEDTLFSHCAVQLPHLHSTLHMFPSVIPKEVDPPPQLERNIVGGNVEIVIHELVNIFVGIGSFPSANRSLFCTFGGRPLLTLFCQCRNRVFKALGDFTRTSS